MHALAFVQFRKYIEGSDIVEINETFESRKTQILNQIKMVVQMKTDNLNSNQDNTMNLVKIEEPKTNGKLTFWNMAKGS